MHDDHGRPGKVLPMPSAGQGQDLERGYRLAVEARVSEEVEAAGLEGGGGGSGVPGSFIWDCAQAKNKGDGLLYSELFADRFAYAHVLAKWYVWAGHHWELDKRAAHRAAVAAVEDAYFSESEKAHQRSVECERAGDRDGADHYRYRAKVLEKKARGLQSSAGVNGALDFATTARGARIGLSGEEFDLDPYLLACPNGTVDLRTGVFRAGRPGDYLLHHTPTRYVETATADAWEAFLLSVFGDDHETVAFLQVLLGYSVMGLTTEHILVLLYGEDGRNGKGTLVETLRSVLGDYADVIAPELLLDQGRYRSSSGPSPDLMKLKGLRVAFASETDESRYLSGATVKRLTGGDGISARAPNAKEEITFDATHTLFLQTNFKPHANELDTALWERILVIPFNYRFVRNPTEANERPADPLLKTKLEAEAEGILAWLVRGAIRYHRDGLVMSRGVEAATLEYRKSESLVGKWLSECCEVGADYRTSPSAAYDAFKEWFEGAMPGRKPTPQNRFGEILKKISLEGVKIEAKKSNNTRYWKGFRLQEE